MKHALALIAIFALFGYEMLWLAILLIKDAPFTLGHPILMHSLFCFVATLLSLAFLKERFRIPWYTLTFILFFISLVALPFFGSLLMTLVIIYLLFVKQEEKITFSTEDLEEEMYPYFEFEKPQKMEEELGEILSRALEIEPYIDILKGRDPELKKGALNKLSEIVDPHSVKIMRLALHDENPEVRLMASKSLSKIEETMNNDITTALERINKSPQNAEVRNHAGALYYRYALLDLHDETTRRFHLQKALNEFLSSLQLSAKQPKILLLLGKIFLRINNFQKAKDIFKRIIELHPQSSDARIFLCNAYLGLRDFENLQSECNFIKNNLTKKNNTQECVEFWTHDERNHTHFTR
ncbi:MAG TPA: HEAT repeat domain-containing protein [Bdellovibrionota bacterium]|nr:HEAT repeat domain-containing protein [Bdellovibrionota bacterium]